MHAKELLRNYIFSELAQKRNGKPLGDDESLLEKGVIDSMSIVQLLSFIEERFMVKVDDDELIPENFETVNAICRLIENKCVTA